MIIDPVVVDGMSDADYHAHPALSSSGARRLLPPSCPALFHHEQTNGGRPDTNAFDFGHAAHQLVLGAGSPIVRIYADLDAQRDANRKAEAKWAKDHADDGEQFVPAPLVAHAPNLMTTYAKEQVAAARAAGAIPLLAKDVRRVLDMAKALKRHPLVGQLLDPRRGRPEVSIFWHDERHGVDRRARFDWLPNPTPGQPLILIDYKSAASADPGSLSRSVANFHYEMQAAWYIDAAIAAGISNEPLFVFIAQEKEPPYLITPFELDPDALAYGRERNDMALEVYRDCSAVDQWPGYSAGIETIGLPPWAYR